MHITRPLRLVIALTLWLGFIGFLFVSPQFSFARNVKEYKDTISQSAPTRAANHTLSFRLVDTGIPPEGYLEITPPTDFTVAGSAQFSELRNVELRVNGVRREVGSVVSASDDKVDIVPGTPGLIRYRLNQTTGIAAGSLLELKIGNHTTLAQTGGTSFSTTTGTTTTPADIPGITNGSTVGTHEVAMRIFDNTASEIGNAGFLIALVDQVGVAPVDTTEAIPPFRFNGQPTSTVGGTTLNVEISLETDEFAFCRFARSPGADYNTMSAVFSNSGLLFHSQVVAVTPNSQQDFYVRCRDDEGNTNPDDYLISFFVSNQPTGSSTENGNGSGSGTGTGNGGTGSGSGSGNSGGPATGGGSTSGSSGGGSGGGGGGGSGGASGGGGGGGFESAPGPYRSGDGQVVITGYASPRAKITVLVDGKAAVTANATNDGSYTATVDKIARGAYTFGIYATDQAGTKSSTFSTSFTVAGARESALSNINIPPSILVSPNPVNPGQALTISGYTFPNAQVTIENEKDKNTASRKSYTVTANSSGAWSTPVDTSGFSNGTYKVRARAVDGTLTSNFSQYTLYGVGGPSQAAGNNSDLNRDGKVNLTDFSILLFWWSTDGGDSNPPADISQDGKVNLTDFSILLFNWTG
ncbi:MAG: hypothetical protein RLZZ360_101 [Candidatus Parcubacteria bacterium]|jgi:hypothetical protein